jgi:hypothetical protein
MAQNGSQHFADPAEVARLIRELLAAIERGELEAREPAACLIVRRLETAAGAFEELARR